MFWRCKCVPVFLSCCLSDSVFAPFSLSEYVSILSTDTWRRHGGFIVPSVPSLQRHHHRTPILIYPGQRFLSSNDEFSFKSHFELLWMTALKWVSGDNNNRKGGAVESKKLLLDEVNLTVLLFRSPSLFGKMEWRAFLSLDSVRRLSSSSVRSREILKAASWTVSIQLPLLHTSSEITILSKKKDQIKRWPLVGWGIGVQLVQPCCYTCNTFCSHKAHMWFGMIMMADLTVRIIFY